jgi:hypothetical protein
MVIDLTIDSDGESLVEYDDPNTFNNDRFHTDKLALDDLGSSTSWEGDYQNTEDELESLSIQDLPETDAGSNHISMEEDYMEMEEEDEGEGESDQGNMFYIKVVD